MSTSAVDVDSLAQLLGNHFGIKWNPEIMATEEPRIFKSVNDSVVEDGPDAER